MNLRIFVYQFIFAQALLLILPGVSCADNDAQVNTQVNNIQSNTMVSAMNPSQIVFGKPATVSLSLDKLPAETMVAPENAVAIETHA